ncbi:UDP-N-acetylglucosamine pyrophosphorylase [Lachnoclostridium sp. Marseille-P6806]|uniref:UDP-N-acetylglucosamine pyrophosphorylase n=1 Tax=Lachnoclostridium sp. Marseille-P6806 TaxID=2364793 RepID=UPI00103127F6|nr:UDP-N-acetylglucosamine pyrophosphorylase [Lachnoclostridium sp. Marseille-P6806]
MAIQDYTCDKLLDLKETIAAALFDGVSYPWEVLERIGAFISELGATLPADRFEKRGENIWVARSAVICDSVSITGPCIVDEDADLRHGAFIRGKAIIGKGCVVGNSCELKNVILFNRCEVPHYNYVGDSVLGFHAHMGAGAITSNIKSDRTDVVIHDGGEQISLGLRKMGAILGDYAEIGCNSVLNPGTVIGRHTNIYPLSMVRGCVPAEHIYKSRTEVTLKKK